MGHGNRGTMPLPGTTCGGKTMVNRRRSMWAGLPALLALFVCLGSRAFADEQAVQGALKALEQRHFTGDRFRFVVIGDTRWWVPVLQSPMFHRAVAEINLLRPDFAVDLGDLILGYTEDESLLQREWAAYFALADQCQVPLFPIVGNHDVTTEKMQAMFEQKVGPTSYSFDYGDAHFICMSSETLGGAGRVDDAQYEWLRRDLAPHKDAAHVFVLMHQPVFRYANGGWERCHELLKQYHTCAVFAGHWHQYTNYGERDGIKYFVTGGGGAEIGGVPEAGDFHHYMLVTVEGDRVTMAVIRTGFIEGENVVTGEMRDRLLNLEKTAVTCGTLTVPQAATRLDATVPVTIANPSDAEVSGTLTWTDVPAGWTVEPQAADYSAPAKGKARLTFHVTAPADKALEGPWPGFEVIYPYPYEGAGPALTIRRSLKVAGNGGK
jgi:hypothetical protein